MSTENLNEISLNTFIKFMKDNDRQDKRYCFIIGSGASFQSGIKTGYGLAEKWVREIKEIFGDDGEKWCQQNDIKDNNLAENYSKIFEERFKLDEKQGFDFLEELMDKKEPSLGYSILAQILAQEKHNLVITTNFDSLMEDALFIYTKKKPLVIGHESLAGYVKLMSKRPVIAKIHRDLLLAPKNTGKEIECLSSEWEKALKGAFDFYTPLVIGYGGNDGSLMGFLENIKKIEGKIFWFYLPKYGIPSERIVNLVNQHGGYFVPIDGFDEMMLKLGKELNLSIFTDNELVKIAEERTRIYQDKVKLLLSENKDNGSEVKEIIMNDVKTKKKTWWTVQLEIDNETDVEKQNQMYLDAIKEFNSFELIANYAIFLSDIKKDYEQAEIYYKKAIEVEPNDADFLVNYAIFLKVIKNDYEKAEFYYKKAIEIEPNHVNNLGNYAVFLMNIRKDYDQAEMYYKKAIEFDPNNANILGNYAKLKIETKNLKEANELIDKSFELNKNEENALLVELWFYRYAVFSEWYNGAEKEIEKLLDKGLKSIGWELDTICELAEKNGHPNIEKLKEFKERITNE